MASERDIPEIKIDEPGNIALKLEGPAQFDVLSVLLQDPKNSNIYWYRKVDIHG